MSGWLKIEDAEPIRDGETWFVYGVDQEMPERGHVVMKAFRESGEWLTTQVGYEPDGVYRRAVDVTHVHHPYTVPEPPK